VSFPLEKKTGVFGKEDERRWKMSQSEAEKSATSAGKNETLNSSKLFIYCNAEGV